MTNKQMILAPSLLAGRHANLAESLAEIEKTAGISSIHLDIMDGHFVPNLSFGPQLIKELRALSTLFFDTHLMLSRPDLYLDAFLEAGADHITVHVEPDYPLKKSLARLKKAHISAGICAKPATATATLLPYLELVDVVLLMTVEPGFGGQSFRPEVLSKIEQLATLRTRENLPFRLEVDGGIDINTGQACRQAGADTFVAGTAFFQAENRTNFVEAFQGKPLPKPPKPPKPPP